MFSEILRTSLSLLYSVTGPETVITPFIFSRLFPLVGWERTKSGRPSSQGRPLSSSS